MKNAYLLLALFAFFACNNTQKTPVHEADSTLESSENKVDTLLKKDDLLIKAKEKELMEKYQ